MGTTEDLLAVILATDADFTWGVLGIVLMVSILFAFISELVVDYPKFWKIFFKNGEKNNMGKFSKKIYALYVQNFIFGVEDSLVSTIGLISGVAVTGASRSTVVVTGAILIFVEAFSMGIGSILSEHMAEEYRKKGSTPFGNAKSAGVVMFFSYFIAGFVPLSPYIFLQPMEAFWISIVFSLVALFILGLVSGKIFKINMVRKGFETFLLGGTGVVVGVVVGFIVQNYFI